MGVLTFKQYLASKEQLLKAIENTPVAIVEYSVKKYCSLTIGETEEEKQLVGLKPKNKIIVEWQYDNVDDPTPKSITFDGVKGIDEGEVCSTFWSGSKLTKWLARHAGPGENHGHKTC
jgi:hypothetical protein